MLSKNIDHAVVGHNYFAYLFSKILLDRKQSVMLLDDERYNYGDFYTETLTVLDIELLKKLGKNYNFNGFTDIDNYLTTKDHFFYLGKSRILLGGKPSENYHELARKFPSFFIKLSNEEYELFNEHFMLYIAECIEQSFDGKKWNSKKPFHYPNANVFVASFEKFYQTLVSNDLPVYEKNYLYTLVNMTRGFYQGVLSSRGTKAELFHGFICLMSPLYKLDHEALKNQLKDEYIHSGGEFKKLQLNELKFQSGSLQSFKLESFEGHIKAKKMSFLGGATRDLPLDVNYRGKIYSCLEGKLIFKHHGAEKYLTHFQNHNILFSSTHKVGTDRPMWFGRFDGHHFKISFIVAQKSGSKESFFHEELTKLINDDFKFVFPEFQGTLEIEDLKFSFDQLIEERRFDFSEKNISLIPAHLVRFFRRERPDFLDPLKNVYYHGPLTNERLGTFSSLLVLRELGPKI
ncbi:MAG: hypothetical protein L6Q33_13950 [Bacteriovoracaceae bacterium]|nr:hypothetical protein [Bacteriovoracaceae bacterium]